MGCRGQDARCRVQDARHIVFEITNNSDVDFYLVNGPVGAPASITLPANSVTRVSVSAKFTDKLIYDVKNVITGEDEVLKAEIRY